MIIIHFAGSYRPHQSSKILSCFLAVLLLSACGERENESRQNQEDTEPDASMTTSTVADSPAFHTGISIREIMASLIDPHADALWNSVRVVSDVNGITEYAPETDDQWSDLRNSAITIIEGANALMMPDRPVAPPGSTGEFPDYEFTPEEVEARLAADFLSWTGFASDLQEKAIDTLEAIDVRDAEKLSEAGAYLDEACEACHSVYWYRAGI